MSRRFDRQYAGQGLVAERPFGILFDAGGAPTSAAVGYAKGAIWIDRTNALVYTNIGTATSATWALVQYTTDAVALTATAAELNRVATLSTRNINVTAATLAVTVAAHDSKTINLNKVDGIAVTLPAATGSGARYRFVVGATVTSNTHTITATGAHMFGRMYTVTDTTAGTLFTTTSVGAQGSTVITLDGTTRGGIKGDIIEIEDVATSILIVRLFLSSNGTEATPFS